MIRMASSGCCALALLALAGCATEHGYTANMNSWVGKPESDVVARWGTPTMVYERNSTRSISYASSQPIVIPPAPGAAAPAPAVAATAYPYLPSCRVQIPIADGRFTSGWEVRGSSCIAG